MHVQCPHCRNPIEVVEDHPAHDVVCPSCGSSIRVDPHATAAFDSQAPVRRIDRFELLEELGVGAFGAVYKARDTELDRIVALKIPRGGNLTTPMAIDRFLREARAAAQLKHPHIVSVHNAGTSEGICYLVSEYVAGATLADRLTAGRLAFRDSAELLATVAEALDYAHGQGVVHRDLKPSNIMLDLQGLPHVMDFGLAKRDAGEITMTLHGQVLGTPAYMSPEQARGEGHEVDARSDVYSLGVILYELLTGEIPFRGNARMLLVQVQQDEPRAPRRLNDNIPRDLETIALKCLAKDPARRYGTAGDLADDLRRFLRGEPIRARPVGRAERAWRWCRRNPRVALLTGMVVLLLLAVAGGSSVAAVLLAGMANRERAAAAQAQREQMRALNAEQDARESAARAREESQRAIAEGTTRRQVVDFLNDVFAESDPLALDKIGARPAAGFGSQTTVQELLQSARQRIDQDLKDQPTVRASVMDSIGRAYRGLGMYADAEPLLENAWKLRAEHYGPESLEAATSLHQLGWLRHMQGRFDEAERTLRQSLALREKLLDPQGLEVAEVKFSLSWLLAERTIVDADKDPHMQEAIALMQQAREIRKQLLGPKHRHVAVSQLGLMYMKFMYTQRFEDYAEAVEVLTVLADGHPGLPSMVALYMQGALMRQSGQRAAAFRLYEQSLKNAEAYLGRNHPLVGLLLGDMAGLANDMGDQAQAELLIRRALDIGRTLEGGHPLMVEGLYKLGDYLRARGDLAEARRLYREALTLAERHFPPDHHHMQRVRERMQSLPAE